VNQPVYACTVTGSRPSGSSTPQQVSSQILPTRYWP